MDSTLDSKALYIEKIGNSIGHSVVNNAFDSSVKAVNGVYVKDGLLISGEKAITEWIGGDIKGIGRIPIETYASNIKQMYEGVKLPNGTQSLGLREINMWKGTDYSCIKHKAGWAAEVISTTKENLKNEARGSGDRVYRADDLPELFPKNDQYVDKVRMDAAGNITERIQTKFVGKNGSECFQKLMSSKFDKYFNDGKVDKVEIPKDYFKDVKKCVSEERVKYERQLNKAIENGNESVKNRIQERIDRLDKLDKMLERSNTTSAEAIQAAKHPRAYAAKQIAKRGVEGGTMAAKDAMIVTGALSTVDNLSKYIDGDISAENAVKNIAIDTATAGAAGFSVGFISNSVGAAMAASGNKLISSVGKAGGGCLPAAAVVYGIEVHDTVVDYAEGTIDNMEFADELCRSGAKVAGGMVGYAMGSAVAGPVGGYVGAAVGSEVATTVYDASKYVAVTTVELAQGETTIDEVKVEVAEAVVDKVDSVAGAVEDGTEKVGKIVGFAAEKAGVDDIIYDTGNTVVEASMEATDSAKEIMEDYGTKIDETVNTTVEKATDYQRAAKELLSSTVEYVVTSEAYITAVDACEEAKVTGSDAVSNLGAKAKEFAGKMVDKASVFGSEAANDVKLAIADFNIKNALQF